MARYEDINGLAIGDEVTIKPGGWREVNGLSGKTGKVVPKDWYVSGQPVFAGPGTGMGQNNVHVVAHLHIEDIHLILSPCDIERVVSTAATTPTRQEAPCKTCGRPNDVGVRVCWCCGGSIWTTGRTPSQS